MDFTSYFSRKTSYLFFSFVIIAKSNSEFQFKVACFSEKYFLLYTIYQNYCSFILMLQRQNKNSYTLSAKQKETPRNARSLFVRNS